MLNRYPSFKGFARAAACLLAAAAAAKPGRSTLDTKKGYKTKTGSTSSVTLTLIKTEYWDRAGGGGNISYGCTPPKVPTQSPEKAWYQCPNSTAPVVVVD